MLKLFKLTRTAVLVSIALASACLSIATTPAHPAQAAVSKLTLYRRSCAAVYAQVTWDSFIQGQAPFKVGFAADLNGDGIYGAAGEPNVTTPVLTGGNVGIRIGSRLVFPALAEGSTVSVTAYDVDNNGVRRSGYLSPITYTCSQRPELADLRVDNPSVVPQVASQLFLFTTSTQVYTQPLPTAKVLGGLAKGQSAEVVALNERGDWAKIRFGDGFGWVLWRTNALMNGAFAELPRETGTE